MDPLGLWPEFLDKLKRRQGKTTYDAHREQHPDAHREIFEKTKSNRKVRDAKKGANRLDKKKVDSVARDVGIPKEFRKQFGDYIEDLKDDVGAGGRDNFTYEDLMGLGRDFKDEFCP